MYKDGCANEEVRVPIKRVGNVDTEERAAGGDTAGFMRLFQILAQPAESPGKSLRFGRLARPEARRGLTLNRGRDMLPGLRPSTQVD